MKAPIHGHHPAHPSPVQRHNTPIILDVTICACTRDHILDNAAAHAAIVVASQQATHWNVGEYLIMPDHIHLFCAPGIHDYPPVRRWAGYWKRLAGNANESLRGMLQPDCWDTQIRDGAHYDEKLAYMRQNPVRRGLVGSWEDWPLPGTDF